TVWRARPRRIAKCNFRGGGLNGQEMRKLLDGQCRTGGSRYHFRSRKRRFLVSLFRSKRRRTDGFWKRSESARYLPERLLLVGPVQGGVVETPHDGGFDDFEIGRDV